MRYNTVITSSIGRSLRATLAISISTVRVRQQSADNRRCDKSEKDESGMLFNAVDGRESERRQSITRLPPRDRLIETIDLRSRNFLRGADASAIAPTNVPDTPPGLLHRRRFIKADLRHGSWTDLAPYSCEIARKRWRDIAFCRLKNRGSFRKPICIDSCATPPQKTARSRIPSEGHETVNWY